VLRIVGGVVVAAISFLLFRELSHSLLVLASGCQNGPACLGPRNNAAGAANVIGVLSALVGFWFVYTGRFGRLFRQV
jgi:hypothetical protein